MTTKPVLSLDLQCQQSPGVSSLTEFHFLFSSIDPHHLEKRNIVCSVFFCFVLFFFFFTALSYFVRQPVFCPYLIGQRFALQEEKLVLAHVLRNFTLDSTQTFDELQTCGEIITRPKNGIFVSLAKR